MKEKPRKAFAWLILALTAFVVVWFGWWSWPLYLFIAAAIVGSVATLGFCEFVSWAWKEVWTR